MEGIIEGPYIKINFDITNEFFWCVFHFSGGEMHFVKVIFFENYRIVIFFFSKAKSECKGTGGKLSVFVINGHE